MEKKSWIVAWIGMYALSVVAGLFWPASVVSHIVGILFFVPPAVLLWLGITKKERKLVRWVRWIAVAELVLTVGIIIAMFVTIASKKNLDALMEALLLLLAAPFQCFKAWVLSLFGWACLVYGSMIKKKR